MAAVDLFKTKWDEIRQAIKARWGDKITDHDLERVAREREQVCHLIGEKCQMSLQKARQELNSILDSIIVSGRGV